MRSWSTLPLGERAILLTCPDASPLGSGGNRTAAAAGRIAAANLPWVIETVPAYDSIAVYLDLKLLLGGIPLTESEAESRMERAANQLARLAESEREETAKPEREVTIPVVYGGESGPDLLSSAQRSGLTERQFIERHSSARYEVAMIGFTPGFPYLRGLPVELAQPRHDTPRLRVPAGSVGIAGGQTGIYPIASPGGWQLIGRTPMRLFRPESDEPFPIRPGDTVRFVPVESEEAWLDSNRNSDWDSKNSDKKTRIMEPEGEPSLAVLRPGLQTTVQDLGRSEGWQAFGVSAGGAMDADSLRVANRLVGNEEGAAGLELTLSGGEYHVLQEILIALTGADLGATVEGERRDGSESEAESLPLNRPVLLRQGSIVRFRGAASGCRAYLAAAGGIAVEPMLGSRSTDLRAGIGGVEGRALRTGDLLRLGKPSKAAEELIGKLRKDASPEAAWHSVSGQASPGHSSSKPAVLRVLEGSGWHRFSEEARRAFFESEYKVGTESDRMGLRLSGAELTVSRKEEILSHGVCAGAIQVPASGQPILLAQGCQPTGGYPIIAHVSAADLGIVAQLRPGDVVSFEAVGLGKALSVYRKKEERLFRLAAGIKLKWFS